MNKLFVLLAICLLAVGGVLAAGGQNSGTSGQPNDADKETGAGTELETQNQGENSEIQARVQTNNPGVGQMAQEQAGNGYRVMTGNNGKEIQIKSENGFGLKIGQTEAKSDLKLETEETENGTKIKVNLSNGRNAEIKVMPDTASETALQRLRLRNCVAEEGCTIELKEVGKGNETEAVYALEKEAQGKFLGLFKTKATVRAQVSAETGEVLKIKKPFLTKVKELESEDVELPEEPEMPESLTE